jgi:biotin carboxylase
VEGSPRGDAPRVRLVPLTLLCIATYLKGHEFLRECRRQGCRVLLLTEEKLRDADWPRDSIDEFFYLRRDMPHADIRKGAAHLARRERIDRIVALDDFDVELAAMLREHLFVPGMGETTGRAFRDKLAMRRRARSAGIPCPEFVHVLNTDAIREWTSRVTPPWVMKPRSQAAAIGIRKIDSADELWQAIDSTGDNFSEYVLEQFVPGDVFHVDSIVFDRKVRFAVASRYNTPPMAVAHEGGIFATRTLAPEDPLSVALLESNARVLASFGLVRGASHTEFIRARSGEWYFLETSARVGGAFIVDVVEAATGINLWREWAKVEIAGEDGVYEPPLAQSRSGGIVLSLARQEFPDTSAYADPEITVRINKKNHAGLIVTSPSGERVAQLLDDYTRRFYEDFHASAPPPERATE